MPPGWWEQLVCRCIRVHCSELGETNGLDQIFPASVCLRRVGQPRSIGRADGQRRSIGALVATHGSCAFGGAAVAGAVETAAAESCCVARTKSGTDPRAGVRNGALVA